MNVSSVSISPQQQQQLQDLYLQDLIPSLALPAVAAERYNIPRPIVRGYLAEQEIFQQLKGRRKCRADQFVKVYCPRVYSLATMDILDLGAIFRYVVHFFLCCVDL